MKKETHTAVIKGLESIGGTRIKPQHIPRVRSFGKEINKLADIDVILDSWVKENSQLKSFVAAERDG